MARTATDAFELQRRIYTRYPLHASKKLHLRSSRRRGRHWRNRRADWTAPKKTVTTGRLGSTPAQCVMTLGAGNHGACSCAPNQYQAVPSQRAIGAGDFLGD